MYLKIYYNKVDHILIRDYVIYYLITFCFFQGQGQQRPGQSPAG